MPLPARHGRTEVRRAQMKRPGDSDAHLTFVGSLPCVVCKTSFAYQATRTHAHHLLVLGTEGHKAMGRKHEDRWTIPLCAIHHNSGQRDSAHGHGNDETWLAEKGIQGRDLARLLWSVSGDADKGLRAVERARK